MISLPEEFLKDMKLILNEEEYVDFLESYNQNKTIGLRINTLKISVDEFLKISPFNIANVPWSKEGFYYDESVDKPGKSPLHEAGIYYIQEPSAMSVVPELNIQDGDFVLDMCAAPGGKSTYIASKLNGSGLLISNEVDSKRVRILSENIERMGILNVVITNSNCEKLETEFTQFFDKILIDAPCSGEGMFRKDSFAIKDWSKGKVLECARIQESILDNAYNMLKGNGIIVYSTCTFSREENEDQIEKFLERHGDLKLIKTHRLWPHKVKGEGHFFAAIKKVEENIKTSKKLYACSNLKQNEIKDFLEFQKKYLNIEFNNSFELRGEELYILPKGMPELKKVKILRAGISLGRIKKNRFEPSHSLAHYLKKEDVKHTIDLKLDSDELRAYMKGETLTTEMNRGWILVTVEGYSLGWGKEVNGVLKNHYPKGLRIV